MSALAPLTDDLEAPPDLPPRRWSVAEQLTAHIVDAVNLLNHTVQQVNSTQTITPPEPLPRPGDPVRIPATLSPETLAAIRARNRHGKETP